MSHSKLAHLAIFLFLAFITGGIFVTNGSAEPVTGVGCAHSGGRYEGSIRDDGYTLPLQPPDNAYDGYHARSASVGMIPSDTNGTGGSAATSCFGPFETGDEDLNPRILPATGAPGMMLSAAGLFLFAGGWVLAWYREKRIGDQTQRLK